MTNRSYKQIHGVAYLNLFKGDRQPKSIQANLSNPNDYYYDDAIRLSDNDVKHFKGKPILMEHGKSKSKGKQRVGEISKAWVDSEGKMRINARIYTDTDGGELFRQVKSGEMKGLSVGYTPRLKGDGTKEVDYKCFDEISICKKPFFEGAYVTVAASLNSKTDKRKKELFINIMADQQVEPTSTNPTPVEENKDAAELLKEADNTQKLMEEKNKELEDMKAKIAEFEKKKAFYARLEADEKEREAKRLAEKQKEADEHLKIALENHKRLHGDDAKLDDDYVNTMKKSWQMKEAEGIVGVMASQTAGLKQQFEENERLKKENEELLAKIKMGSAQLRDVARVTASYAAVTEPVDNSNKADPKNALEHLFVPRPSAQEIKCYGLDPDDYNKVSVEASAEGRKKLDEIPTHNHMDWCPNSMRKNAPALFAHIIRNKEFSGVTPRGFRDTTEFEDPRVV